MAGDRFLLRYWAGKEKSLFDEEGYIQLDYMDFASYKVLNICDNYDRYLEQYRIIIVVRLRSQIFRQIVQ